MTTHCHLSVQQTHTSWPRVGVNIEIDGIPSIQRCSWSISTQKTGGGSFGWTISDQSRVCGDDVTCAKCGQELGPAVSFCTSCGTKVGSEATGPTSPSWGSGTPTVPSLPSPPVSSTVPPPPPPPPHLVPSAMPSPPAVPAAMTQPPVTTPPPPLLQPSSARTTPSVRFQWNRRVAVVIAAVVVAVLVVVGAGVGIGLAISGTSQQPIAVEPVVPDSESVEVPPGTDAALPPTPLATPTPQPSAVATLAPYEFSSQSGNLRCRIDAESAWCHQGVIAYTPPTQNCAAGGVAVGVTVDSVFWPCLQARPAQAPAVGYDVPVVYGDFTCIINLDRGATCTNPGGDGFTIEYAAGVATF